MNIAMNNIRQIADKLILLLFFMIIMFINYFNNSTLFHLNHDIYHTILDIIHLSHFHVL